MNSQSISPPNSVYAMIDCNNFYASCERVFDPSLNGKPIAILSNNDGCVIARSQEAKDAGIPMGAAAFKFRDEFKARNVAVRSSNYALYGDMSHRVMEILQQLTHEIEIYSIDEAFAKISANIHPDLTEYGHIIRKTIFKWTGLPVSVGIAASKTLAKIANHTAKTHPEFNGVLNLCEHSGTDIILEHTPLQEIWGIGRGLTLRLNRYGIHNALELKHTIQNKTWVRKHLAVTGLRTVLELNGIPCIPFGEALPYRKGILTSRMFGKPLYELADIQEAVATYMSRAAEKLRSQNSVASVVYVVLIGDKYDNLKGKYKYSSGFPLNVPTAHTPTLICITQKITESLFLTGTKYKKAGVMLTGIIPNSEVQMDLFAPQWFTNKQYRLMACIDSINTNHGRNKVAFAATGLHKKTGNSNRWEMNQNFLSRRYTTHWDELMVAKAK